MKTLTSKQKAIQFLKLTYEKVTVKKTGIVEVRRSYFYSHGATQYTFAAAVQAKLEANGHKVRLDYSLDEYRNWPKTSYFVAAFIIE